MYTYLYCTTYTYTYKVAASSWKLKLQINRKLKANSPGNKFADVVLLAKAAAMEEEEFVVKDGKDASTAHALFKSCSSLNNHGLQLAAAAASGAPASSATVQIDV